MNHIHTLFLLIAGWALADFGLQSDWVAKHKLPGSFPYWRQVLTTHSLIHGLTVYVATSSVLLAVFETAAHWGIDYAKGRNLISFTQDQFLHLWCRLLWFFLYLLSF